MSFRSVVEAVHFMSWRDVALFRRSARADAVLTRDRPRLGNRGALEAVYADADPWASADPAYRYQRRKYETILSLLPAHRFRSAVDLGCGVGLMTRMLASHADTVLGLDLAQAAIDSAQARTPMPPSVRFAQADLLDLPRTMDGQFDLVVLADTLYYLRPIDEALLAQLALRAAQLLVPGGLCVLANHYFTGLDTDSRLSRRIHNAFVRSPVFSVIGNHRRPFYLVSILQKSVQTTSKQESGS